MRDTCVWKCGSLGLVGAPSGRHAGYASTADMLFVPAQRTVPEILERLQEFTYHEDVLRIGLAGWHYKDWAGDRLPGLAAEGVPVARRT